MSCAATTSILSSHIQPGMWTVPAPRGKQSCLLPSPLSSSLLLLPPSPSVSFLLYLSPPSFPHLFWTGFFSQLETSHPGGCLKAVQGKHTLTPPSAQKRGQDSCKASEKKLSPTLLGLPSPHAGLSLSPWTAGSLLLPPSLYG